MMHVLHLSGRPPLPQQLPSQQLERLGHRTKISSESYALPNVRLSDGQKVVLWINSLERQGPLLHVQPLPTTTGTITSTSTSSSAQSPKESLLLVRRKREAGFGLNQLLAEQVIPEHWLPWDLQGPHQDFANKEFRQDLTDKEFQHDLTYKQSHQNFSEDMLLLVCPETRRVETVVCGTFSYSLQRQKTHFDTVEEGIEAFRNGEFVVVLDNEDRENEGDLIIAAEAVTPENVAFMVRYTSGLICTPMDSSVADTLQLPLMVSRERNEESHRTAFTVSVDLAQGVSTGISASDRAATIRALANPTTMAADLVRPGHIFPLRARKGGVCERSGHTEAAVDLCKWSGFHPAVGAICEIVRDDGTMARRDELLAFAQVHGFKVLSIHDMIQHALGSEISVGER